MVDVITRSALASGLQRLGVGQGDVVLAHTSLSSFGYVVGGAVTVCHALFDVVGESGTVVMPGFTPQLCHPSSWPGDRRRGIEVDAVAAEMPAFDAATTPVAASIGAAAECLRSWPGARRSDHPHTSFVAVGAAAEEIVQCHPVEYRLSSSGPLGRLRCRDAKVVMLGVAWPKCTAFHLGEYESAYPGRRTGRWLVPYRSSRGCATAWREVDELMVWEGDFDVLGDRLCATNKRGVTRTAVGRAKCVALPLTLAAEFSADWLATHRDLRGYADGPGWREVRWCSTRL